jgi:DNA-binding MarR family transcriptional regulator
MKNKRLGLFIDLEIINNPELDCENKFLLSEIISLSKLEKGCYASNQSLADFLQIKRQSIHRRIKFLVDNGYITTENKFSGGKCVGRKIYPTGKLMTAQASVMEAQASGMEAHADTMEAQAVINDSTGLHSMTAESDPINTLYNSDNTFINTVINTVINTEKNLTEEEELNIILAKYNIN